MARANIADNRNILILLCQGVEINLDIDADPELKVTYEDLRLRVVNDPVGQCVVVELLLSGCQNGGTGKTTIILELMLDVFCHFFPAKPGEEERYMISTFTSVGA